MWRHRNPCPHRDIAFGWRKLKVIDLDQSTGPTGGRPRWSMEEVVTAAFTAARVEQGEESEEPREALYVDRRRDWPGS